MKQTQTHAWSPAGEEAVAYSLARRNAATVTLESGEVAACFLAREKRRRQSLDRIDLHLVTWAGRAGRRTGTRPKPLLSYKQKQLPSAGLDTMRGARAR